MCSSLKQAGLRSLDCSHTSWCMESAITRFDGGGCVGSRLQEANTALRHQGGCACSRLGQAGGWRISQPHENHRSRVNILHPTCGGEVQRLRQFGRTEMYKFDLVCSWTRISTVSMTCFLLRTSILNFKHRILTPCRLDR